MTLRLAPLFTDHAVVQRRRPVPVWGTDAPGTAVTVTLGALRAEAKAGADGCWRAELPAMEAGGPFELTVAGSRSITLRDVLIGEVWLCSGQSNMQWSLSQARDAEAEIQASDYPRLRAYNVALGTAEQPQAHVAGQWLVSSPQTSHQFSAVAYFFGVNLLRRLDVPIGLVHSSWGGTVAEAWTSREALLAEPVTRPIVEKLDDLLTNAEAHQARYAEALAAWERENLKYDPGISEAAATWADPERAGDDAWPTMEQPMYWQSAGLDHSGVVWFRKWVDVPADWAGGDLALSLGACDKGDITFWNGVRVGSIMPEDDAASWQVSREYRVPAALVRPGLNLLAVRIYSHQFAGGFAGPAAKMKVHRAGQTDGAIRLDGVWEYRVEHNFGKVGSAPPVPMGRGNQNMPTGLFNAMIAPLIPYAMRGCIWYQGESNAGRSVQYRTLLPTLIGDWRARWNDPEFAFLIVQLANYRAPQLEPCEQAWPYIREAQAAALALEHTGLAVTLDIGEANDIHPRNKQDVGRRLALWALAKTYGCGEVVHSGPLYRASRRNGAAMAIAFDHASGLTHRVNGSGLSGVTICGEDRVWRWAQVSVEGETLVAHHPEIAEPVAVRYGWADNPPCTLYNAAGLPAAPFRTDDWAAPEGV